MKEDKDLINLVLLRWYDGVDGEEEMYGCPKLCLTDQYTYVYLDSVDIIRKFYTGYISINIALSVNIPLLKKSDIY